MHKRLLIQYLNKGIVTSLDLYLINNEIIKAQGHIKDTESKTLHIIRPKGRVISLDHVLYFDINVRGEKNNDSLYPS